MNMRLTGWVENKYSMSIHMWLSTNKRVYGCLLFTASMFLMHTNKLWTEVGGNPKIILVLSSSLCKSSVSYNKGFHEGPCLK